MDRGLARRVHLGAGLNDIAHDDGPHLLGIEPSAGDGGFDDDRAEIGRRNLFQAAAKGTDRGSHWRDNNDRVLRHRSNSQSDSSDAYDELAEIAPAPTSGTWTILAASAGLPNAGSALPSLLAPQREA